MEHAAEKKKAEEGEGEKKNAEEEETDEGEEQGPIPSVHIQEMGWTSLISHFNF